MPSVGMPKKKKKKATMEMICVSEAKLFEPQQQQQQQQKVREMPSSRCHRRTLSRMCLHDVPFVQQYRKYIN